MKLSPDGDVIDSDLPFDLEEEDAQIKNIIYAFSETTSVNLNHIYQAAQLVDDAFAAGYFKNHLNEIHCAWVALDGDKVVGWAAVGDCILRCIVVHRTIEGQGIGKEINRGKIEIPWRLCKVVSCLD